MQPRKTNQDIADESGLSVNAVGQFLRGETKSPSYRPPLEPPPRNAHPWIRRVPHRSARPYDTSEVERLRLQLENAERVNAIYEKGLKRKNVQFWVLSAIVLIVLLALLVDLCNPNVGWIRAAFTSHMEVWPA